MSAPIDDAEVENVLSAIRRLIGDGRTDGRAVPAAAGRLVLTPSLRVPAPPAAPAPPLPPAPAPTMGTPRPAAPEPLLLRDALPAAVPATAERGGPRMPVALPMSDPQPDSAPALRRDPSDEGWSGPTGPASIAPAAPEPAASWPDEATLRALVAEAVREELRGELGERLTRNLRKLVRHEVMQALAMRGLG